MFTTPCFIRMNTPELRKKLADLGYTILFSARYCYGNGICARNGFVSAYMMPSTDKDILDCGTNEQLFLALAALRDDSDKFQWFCDNRSENWVMCKDKNNPKHSPSGGRGWWTEHGLLHKASVEEIWEHFKE